MPESTARAPRGTRALIRVILNELDNIQETDRKSAMKHAVGTVRAKLIAQSEKAKAASRRAPRKPGAKRAAAVSVIRAAASADARARARD